MSVKEILSQLSALNENCREALEKNDLGLLRLLIEFKKDLLVLLKESVITEEDLPALEEALRQEKELATLALAKRESLEERLNTGLLH